MASFNRLCSAFGAALLYGAIVLVPAMAVEPSSPPVAEAPKTDSTAHKAGETAGSAWQSGKDAVRKAWGATKETARNVWQSGKETTREGWTAGKETAKDAWDTTKEKTSEVTRDVKEGWKDGKQ
jgi:hypothetical protein